jgi:hypothetical protein
MHGTIKVTLSTAVMPPPISEDKWALIGHYDDTLSDIKTMFLSPMPNIFKS